MLPALATFVLFVVMFGAGSARYDNFFSLQVLLNPFVDNAYLIVLAVGMTFVIITGGIDLGVGSVVALSGVLAAKLLASGWSAVRHGPRPAQRSGSGADHGARHPPPGAAAVRGDPGGHVPRPRALRRDQRRVHPHPRPPVMGLRVGRTKVAVSAISGLCSAIGGLLFAFYSLSGYSLSAVGTELDAIAAAVIGSTLLSGGVGLIVRSLLECSCWA